MSADEQLIEHLRASMRAAADEVVPAPGLLEGISPGRRRRLRLPSLGGVAAVLATGSALAVTAIALLVLRRDHAPGRGSVPPSAARPTQPTSLAGLRAELAILRRRQTAADRLPAWAIAAEQRQNCSNCLNVARVIPRYTRLVASVRLPRFARGSRGRVERIYLVLGTIPQSWGNGLYSGWRQRGRAIEGLHLSLVGGFLGRRSHMEQPTDQLINPLPVAMPTALLTPRDVLVTSFATVGLVPDGVTRVRWELANPGQARPVAVTPRIRGNVARAPWTPAPRSTALINEQLLVGATWYGAHGQVLASFHDNLAAVNRAFSP